MNAPQRYFTFVSITVYRPKKRCQDLVFTIRRVSYLLSFILLFLPFLLLQDTTKRMRDIPWSGRRWRKYKQSIIIYICFWLICFWLSVSFYFFNKISPERLDPNNSYWYTWRGKTSTPKSIWVKQNQYSIQYWLGWRTPNYSSDRTNSSRQI